MSERPSISIEDLTPELRAKLRASGVKAPRKQRSMSANEVRTLAIRVLAVMADRTPQERRRILKHAAKLNEV